ncbi:MAG: class I SAM-dependent methyltransferase [Anaerolineales bacterium]|nr:class I SAM-dependent methyltransferase [Anaerolineales bacterium]
MSEKKNIIDTFTELAPRYEKTMDHELRYIWNTSYPDLVKHIASVTPVTKTDLILDLATGTARIPLALLDNHPGEFHTIGLDITPAMLRYGHDDIRKKGVGARVQLVCGSGMEMPFADNSFDLITCGLGMHHMRIQQTVHNIQKKLKPGGTLVIVAVSAPRAWRRRFVAQILKAIIYLVFMYNENPARARAEASALESIQTTGEWHYMLSKAGFSEVKINVHLVGRYFWFPNGITIIATKEGG